MHGITQVDEINLNKGHITKMCWSLDGRFLALPTQSGWVPIFDILKQQIVVTVGRHSGSVTTVAWDHRAEFIMTGSRDRSIGLWEVNSGRRAPFSFRGHKTTVHSIEWTDEEAYAITCSLDRLRALDGSCLLPGWSREMEDGVNRRTNFTAASCSRQSTFLLGMASDNGALLSLVGLMSADVLSTVRMKYPVRCLAWSPVEDVLAAGTDRKILLFRATQEGFEGTPYRFTEQSPEVHALSFSSDGSILASRDDQGLKFWSVKGGKLMAVIDETIDKFSSKLPVSGIAFHPSQPILATVARRGTAFRLLDASKLV